jgi:hypothetical protein
VGEKGRGRQSVKTSVNGAKYGSGSGALVLSSFEDGVLSKRCVRQRNTTEHYVRRQTRDVALQATVLIRKQSEMWLLMC